MSMSRLLFLVFFCSRSNTPLERQRTTLAWTRGSGVIGFSSSSLIDVGWEASAQHLTVRYRIAGYEFQYLSMVEFRSDGFVVDQTETKDYRSLSSPQSCCLICFLIKKVSQQC